MSIFQTSVLKKHLKLQDKNIVEKAYRKFTKYFHNTNIQQNIRESKEEQFQQKFLIELFEKIFGYTIFPDDKYNLTTEFKNLKGAKKADGAILADGKALAVVELKGTKTKNLESIRQQAFDYKSNHPTCVYVITSNFEKLRFYIKSSDTYEEFNLFNLSLEHFELMYLCLNKENLLKNTPLTIKEESIQEEESITKKFYADYSLFKRELFRDLVKRNMKNEVFRTELNNQDSERGAKNIKQTLFKKSQKLIDRFLFIFFAEDRGLLPPNSTIKILEQWKELKELDEVVPLYSRYKKYFSYLDQGRKGTNKTAEIFAYNGGLFKPDAVLDSLLISDEVLNKHTKNLSNYDFESQVDVNILGHIFENSLNEIESINAEIEGTDFDKQKTKRKKDGVFYTPKYITKYIVDNTVGKLCTEKKSEFAIQEEEYLKSRKGRPVKILKALEEKLKTYREWLLTITILDPACGSGAFLNQALDFLIKEHQYIDELLTSLTGGGMVLPTNPNTILENNIYGVDLNEESVEIAKLSLWLRTAQPRRKLNTLNNNIKCGNSLIDSKTIAGDKAFDWHKEFPQIFNSHAYAEEKTKRIVPDEKPDYIQLVKEKSKEAQQKAEKAAELSREALEISKQVYAYAEKIQIAEEPQMAYNAKPKNKGGFDVVIGNPPYGVSFNDKEKKYLAKLDKLVPDYEIYIYFISLATNKLLKKEGFLSYIFPNTFLSILYGKNYRQKTINNFELQEIVDLSNDNTFVDAAVRTCILILQNKQTENYDVTFKKIKKGKNIKQIIEVTKQSKHFLNSNIDNWLNLSTNTKVEAKLIEKIKGNKIIKDYFTISQGLIPYDKYRGHTEYQIKNRVFHSNTKIDTTYKKELKGGDIHRYGLEWNGNLWISYGKWLAAPRKLHFFNSARILVREITSDLLYCSYSDEEYYNTPSLINIIENNSTLALKYALTILNSKVIGWYHNSTSPKAKKGLFPKILVNDVRNLPIKEISTEAQAHFIEKADIMLSLNKELQKENANFLSTLKEEKGVAKITKKLSSFADFQYDMFKKELQKQKIKISLGEENNEWREYFNTSKQKVNALQSQINQTDKEIDKMVYALYGLSEEEVQVVEGS